MSAVKEMGSEPPLKWQDLPKEGVFATPLVQTEDTRWVSVRAGRERRWRS